MEGNQTRGWWLIRIELAFGIFAVLMAGWMISHADVCFGCFVEGWPLPVPAYVLIPTLALLVAIVGVAWMLRIFRGPRDAPPPWRYRDR